MKIQHLVGEVAEAEEEKVNPSNKKNLIIEGSSILNMKMIQMHPGFKVPTSMLRKLLMEISEDTCQKNWEQLVEEVIAKDDTLQADMESNSMKKEKMIPMLQD